MFQIFKIYEAKVHDNFQKLFPKGISIHFQRKRFRIRAEDKNYVIL